MTSLTRSSTAVLVVPLLALVTACGGNKDKAAPAADSSANTAVGAGAAPAAPAAGASSAAAAPVTGKTIEVKMVGDDKGYRYEPAKITLKAGDAIKFINVSGGPHNVAFWADSIPAGAAAQLGANMPNTSEPLNGPILVDPNATYIVSFGGLAPGEYKLHCTPHLAMNMKATVTVQ